MGKQGGCRLDVQEYVFYVTGKAILPPGIYTRDDPEVYTLMEHAVNFGEISLAQSRNEFSKIQPGHRNFSSLQTFHAVVAYFQVYCDFEITGD